MVGFVRRALAAPAVMAAALVGGCSAKSEPSCVAVSAGCAALYAPTFANVFTRTLQPTCAAGGGSCHAAGKGGLTFDTVDNAYAQLLGTAGGAARVLPGDPGCSLLVEKLESSDSDFQMPPGAPLTAAERCSIVQWIAQGAKRP